MIIEERHCTQAKNKVVACAKKIGTTLLSDREPLRMIMFGSRASCTNGSRSDFDIGIDAGSPLPANVITRIRKRFDDLNILQEVDVVDLQAVDEQFARLATAHIEVIFER